MRDTFVRVLMDIAKKDKNVCLITGDLGFGVLKPFWEALPDQFINAGIAEQNMTSVATGMALEGKTVFTYSIGNFPTLRCLEQIRNDAAYHNANVKIVCVGGGFCYGALGMSHHATEDIAILRALPDVVVIAPGDLIEATHAVKAIHQHQGTCYLRLGRGGEKVVHSEIKDFELGKAIQLLDGHKVAIFSAGAILEQSLIAANTLNEKGVSTALYSFHTIKPIDSELIKEASKKFDLIVTVEEHNIIGGFGSAIAEVMAEQKNNKAFLKRIGIEDKYSSIVGSQDYLRNVYGMSSSKIIEKVLNYIEE